MVNDTYSDIISNAGGIYKYTIYLHNPHFTAPVRSPVRTPRFSSRNKATTKFYIARADSAPPTTPHAPMSLTDSAGPGVAARRRGSNWGIQWETKMLPMKRGVLHIVVTAPPRLSYMCLADALVTYFAKSLKVVQGHLKWQPLARVRPH